MSGKNVYTDDTGKTYNTDYPVVIGYQMENALCALGVYCRAYRL